MLADVVRLLREVAPEWRFTYWGNYAPQLDGVFGVWTVPMDDYRPALGARLRARGDQVWVYNPPGYRISSGALAARAVYWWLWTEHIPGVYQWTISAWIEWTGDTRLWDPYRNASWVVPGPDAPLDTIRFELAREGLEDYEYLVLLETLARQAEARGLADAAAAARKLLDDSRGIAWSPADGRAAILHTRSPRELHTQRERLAEGIETLAEALGHGR
jgi:hypothetical protein